MLRALALSALLSAAPAAAQADSFTHQGSVFGVIAPGAGYQVGGLDATAPGGRWCGIAGGGFATPLERLEVLVLGRGTGRTGAFEAFLLGGVRTTFLGDDRLGTFADVMLALQVWPGFSLGPRFAMGVQLEVAPVAGVFCGAGVQAGFGNNLYGAADVTCGLQLRTYVL